MGNEVSSNLPNDWATVDMVNRFTFCPRLFHLMYDNQQPQGLSLLLRYSR